MNNTEYQFLYLLHCAVTNKTPIFNDEVDYKTIYSMSRFHSLAALIYKAIEKTNASIEVKKVFEKKHSQSVMKYSLFESERAAILSSFEKEKVWYVPLKGIIVNTMYPYYGTREFSDNDILFDKKKRKVVRKIFKARHYSFEHGEVHDCYLKKPCYNFEMHVALFEKSHNRRMLDRYYKASFPKLLKDENNNYGYHFSDNDFFIYLVAHAYKHYGYSGNGIRYLIDFHQFLKHKPDLDLNYIHQELQKMEIDDFFITSMSLSDKLFGESMSTDFTNEEETMLSYILHSGTYGTIQNGVSTSMNENGGSGVKYVLSRLFLPYSTIKQVYPFIAKTYIFIPLVPIIRVFKSIRKYKTVQVELSAVKDYKENKKKER